MKVSPGMDEILADAVNQGLQLICCSASQSVLFFLQRNNSINSIAKIENLKIFSEGLENIFGAGSKVIEKKIIEILYIKLELLNSPKITDKLQFEKEVKKAFKLYETHQCARGV